MQGVPAHVLDHAKHRDLERLREADGLAAVEQGHVLWRGHDDHPVDVRQGLRHRQRLVGRARWEIDDEVIEVAPLHVANELLNRPEFDGAAPHHGGVVVIKQESHRDDLHAEVALGGMDAPFFDVEASTVKSHHFGHVWTGDVDVEDAHLVPLLSQGEGQSGGDGGLPNAAFPREHHDLVFDALPEGLHGHLALHLRVSLFHLALFLRRGAVGSGAIAWRVGGHR